MLINGACHEWLQLPTSWCTIGKSFEMLEKRSFKAVLSGLVDICLLWVHWCFFFLLTGVCACFAWRSDSLPVSPLRECETLNTTFSCSAIPLSVLLDLCPMGVKPQLSLETAQQLSHHFMLWTCNKSGKEKRRLCAFFLSKKVLGFFFSRWVPKNPSLKYFRFLFFSSLPFLKMKSPMTP